MNYLQFNSSDGEIDSFESVYGDFLINSDEIKIPWLNVGLYEHPINNRGIDSIMYIKNVTFLIKGIALVLKNGQLIYNTNTIKKKVYSIFSIEGINVNTGILDGFEFICDESYMLVPDNFILSSVSYLENKYEFISENRFFLDKS